MRMTRRILAVTLCLLTVFAVTVGASAAVYRKTTTHSYSCKAHSDCQTVTFVSEGNTVTGQVYDKYFSGNNSHWPNAFRYDNVWSYKIGNAGFAKGTYTLYSSLVTQWASIAFSSTSNTITHTY